jgi:hypothetical protein
VLRRILGHKREKVTGGWKKMQKEIHNLYSLTKLLEKSNKF